MVRLDFRFFIVILILFSFAVAALLTQMGSTAYSFSAFLPLAYVFFLLCVFLSPWKKIPNYFVLMCLFVAFLRYVVYPFLVFLNDGYIGRSGIDPQLKSYNLAVGLMVYEAAVIGLAILVLEFKYKGRLPSFSDLSTKNYNFFPAWFLVFIFIIAVFLLMLQPRSLLMISVFVPSISDTSNSSLEVFVAIFFIISKVFVCVGLLVRLSKVRKYRSIALFASVLVCVLNIGVFFGGNRIAVLLNSIVTLWMFYILNKDISIKKFAIPFAVVAFVFLFVFKSVTQERNYVKVSDTYLGSVVDNIQAYTGGVYNVAIGVEIKSYYPEASSFSVLLQDVIRPTVGLNLLVRNSDVYYSNMYFNQRMWNYVDRRSQIIPMVAQGYLFFGVLLAPALSCVFVFVAYWLMKVWAVTKSLEMKFCIMLICLRIGFFWGQNTMNMMNYISLYLIVPFIVFYFYKLLRRRV